MIKAWRELVTIPTYEIGKAEKNPIFLEKRVYQGSSGVVYPYPVIESISDTKEDKEYLAVWLENEYIKVMILPELGGRVQMAYDKIKQRHFVYYNHVVKPALVGLTGPWISGGIEFNWPQHHRPSTFLPVDTTIEDNDDGSVTVWVNEMERMFHQKGMAGFTLRPGCAYLEIKGVVYNRTNMPQTFLWWANPAVEVNDYYQSVFPPDINAVFDHGKRAVSSFPIATGTYYKMDYSAGVDISNYKNIKVPTSYMGVNSKYDFEGGYENDTKAGMLHVASHHYSPGKKQWTWGNGDFGRAWDRNLTDEVTPQESRQWQIDREGYRPYIELMAGVYTENQPDFSWLMPYEEKHFVQYFMPYRELGVVKQATKDFIFNIEAATPSGGGNQVRIKLLATSEQKVYLVLKDADDEEYMNKEVTLSPENVYDELVDVKGAQLDELRFFITKTFENQVQPVTNAHYPFKGRIVMAWMAESDEIRPIPNAAEAALSPQETKTADQLYLTGLHLEQYRHATWSALDYYEEALRRDPRDVRCLNQIGLWYLRRGRFDKAQDYLQRCVKIWQKRNPNPYDGEPIFNLALTLKYQHRPHEAYELFWKSTWNKAWADAGYYEAACISLSEWRFEDALDEVERSLSCNSLNHKARFLKAVILRKMGRFDDAIVWTRQSLKIDPFNYGCIFEEHLLTGNEEPLKRIANLMHGNVFNYHELALDYAQAGQWVTVSDVLQMTDAQNHPMTYYYIGWANFNLGDLVEANSWFEKAEQVSPDYCFPNRLEDVQALSSAIIINPDGAKAPYYLGCLYYAARQYDLAIEYWESSAKLDPAFPTVWRNLALARFNKEDRQDEALSMMEQAFSLNEDDERILMELDELYKRLQRPHRDRLHFIQHYPHLIARRDDLLLEEITLLNQTGHYESAMHKLDSHHFHPWEGGEGKVSAQYQICRVEQAKKLLQKTPAPSSTDIDKAIALLEECLEYPHHLGEGKLFGAQENDFHYFLGCAFAMKGDTETANKWWEEATKGPQEPAAAMYYNDAKPDKIFYQGMALLKLGRKDEANGRFYKLVNFGKQHLFEKQVMDYFAVSLPDLLIWEDSLDRKNEIHCKYMLALGNYGLGDTKKAMHYLGEVEKLDINHQGVQALRTLVGM